MAANMFVVNEVRAMDKFEKDVENNGNGDFKGEKEKEKQGNLGVQEFLNKVLYCENTINLIGGVFFSCANNYFKWLDYSPGLYFKLGCLGWRFGRLIKYISQFDINLNLGRGAFWLIAGAYNLIKGFTAENNQDSYFKHLHVSYLIASPFKDPIALILSFLVQGFVSAPLTFHISNFNISISLDSIIWIGIGYILELKVKKEIEKKR